MKKEYHIITTVIFLTALAYIFDKITVTLCLAAFIYCLIPDLDQLDGIKQFLGHRNILTHSIILWVIVALFNPDPIFVLIPAVIGLHCLMDVNLRPKKQVGFYRIKLFKFGSLNGTITTGWLIANFLISFIALIIWGLI